MSDPKRIQELKNAVTALESQRDLLGDSVVDTSVSALKQKLQKLSGQTESKEQLRKYATVLFADVSGFTAICSRNDAENVTDAINALWEPLDRIIVNSGGRIDKHIGDCVMAVWGAEVVREDDALRAVRAALSMQLAAWEISADSSGSIPPLQIRIGLHTGHLFVTPVGLGDEYTVMGDTVNVASRLQNLAPLGSVLVSDATWKHVSGQCAGEKNPPVQVKGIDEPIQTFVVQGLKSSVPSSFSRVLSGSDTSMVGRLDELAILEAGYRRCVSEERAFLFTVSGEAGIGKSRLVHEFLGELSLQGIQPVSAGCSPGMEDVPCALYRNLLCSLFSIQENDPAERVLEKLSAGMSLHLSLEECRLAAVFTGFEMPRMDSPGHGESGKGREALLVFLRALAREKPFVLVLEDLHWADTVSLDFTEEIVRRFANQALPILVTARPPLFIRRQNWGKSPFCTSILLEPLSSLQTMAMIKDHLKKFSSVPADLAELIVKNADGNPFYVEELVKMLAEEGVIDTETLSVNSGALSGIKVPSTLTGVLQARLDSLGPEDRKLLQAASVVGRVFWDVTVGDLFRGTSMDRSLTSVEMRDLIHRMESSSFLHSREYLFKHTILRDVTYETVLLKARKRYHKLVARWLSLNSGDRADEYSSLIAGHYERAECWPEALKWLKRAVSSAMRVSAYKEAVAVCSRALSIPGEFIDTEGTVDLMVNRGSCLEKLSRYPEARVELLRALLLCNENLLYRQAASALSTLAWISLVTGKSQEARQYARQALTQAGKSGDMNTIARVNMRMADFEENQEYDTVLSYYNRALGIYRETESIPGKAIALLNMGNVAIAFQKIDEAGKWYRESLELYRSLGDRWGEANCLGNLGCVASEQGDHAEARDLYSRSLQASLAIFDREGEVICSLNLGDNSLSQKNLTSAGKWFNRALSVSRDSGLLPLMLAALRGCAAVLLENGMYRESSFLLCGISENELLNPDEKEKVLSLLKRISRETGEQGATASSGEIPILELVDTALSHEY